MELPERTVEKNSIKLFTSDDKVVFRKELFADDNPLWTLYDGYYPGSTDNPED